MATPPAVGELELLPVESLQPYENNPRLHSEAQLDRLVRSIKEFGFTNPILIDKDRNVIAGHGRLMAANLMKLRLVPTITIDHLSADQQRAYVIADNQLALNSSWDDDVLQSELAALADVKFDLTVLGWGEDLPTFGDDIDLSALDDIDDEDLSDYAAGVRKAIQIDFEAEDYEEAKALVAAARKRGEYVGMKLIEALSA
jgi:ParB-like chromosome segregation protein Spo0J